MTTVAISESGIPNQILDTALQSSVYYSNLVSHEALRENRRRLPTRFWALCSPQFSPLSIRQFIIILNA